MYAFALTSTTTAAAGPGRVLKVGRVGPNSDARFRSQHYSATSAGSSLGRSLVGHPVLWPWLGIEHLDQQSLKQWMLTNLDRLNIYVPASDVSILPALEMYVRARFGSVFEGSVKSLGVV